jgi:hypothetical protein
MLLQQYIQQYCLVRDARRMMLKMQWLRWEAQHHRRILKDIHFRGTPLASEPKGSVVRDLDFALVNDTIKQQVVRQCVHAYSIQHGYVWLCYIGDKGIRMSSHQACKSEETQRKHVFVFVCAPVAESLVVFLLPLSPASIV